MQITINRNGENYGPYSLEQVREMLDSGQAQPTDMGNVEGNAGAARERARRCDSGAWN